ncbi:helix-turn-helix domain-containing protein [Pseudarcicella hirudinis]
MMLKTQNISIILREKDEHLLTIKHNKEMTIGEKIRQLRLLKGLSQENMADMLNLSTTAYGDIERNKTDLTINRARQIAGIMEVSLSELLETETFPQKAIIQNPVISKSEEISADLEKLREESDFWKERYERQLFIEVFRTLQNQHERQKIGF